MDTLIYYIEKINNIINSIVWGPIMLVFFMLVGIMFSIRLKFFQIVKLKLWVKSTILTLFTKQDKKSSGISSFQAMTTALAGSIGTGNIVGVATAITLGGPGSIFWMWIAAFFSMMTIFAENVLGMLYREKNLKGQWVGGPMYYIEKGLKSKWLAVIFSVTCILATFGMGNMTQANSISTALNDSFNIEPRISGIIISILSAIIILGGTSRITHFTEKIVPFMALFYIVGGLIIIFYNKSNLPAAIKNIFINAFNFKAISSGGTGFIISKSIKYGISRGVFSNEAGLGSSPIIYSAADENEPIVQGMWGIFQVFFDTIIGCSITALCILTSGPIDYKMDSVALSISAFSSVFGRYGSIFVSFSIIMFAFATIIGWSYYGEKGLEYIFKGKYITIYKSFYIILILFGSVMDLNLVWDLSDTFNGLMAIPNLIALLVLSNQVIKAYNQYINKLTK